MVDLTLVASSLGASVAGGMFLAAGLNVRSRAVTGEAATALHLLSLWWLGLAMFAVAGASVDLTAALGARPFELFLVFHYMRIVALCIGLWGLMYYVTFVLTGSRSVMAPLAAFYALYYAAIVFVITLGQPMGVEAAPFPRLALAAPVVDAAAAALLLVIPPLVAAITYLALFLKAEEPTQRMRIVLVAVGTLAWLAGTVLREASVATVTPIALGLLSAWAVSWAYGPPEWARRRLGFVG